MRSWAPRSGKPRMIHLTALHSHIKERTMSQVELTKTAAVKFNYRANKDTKVQRPSVELEVPEITDSAVAGYLTHEDPKVKSLVLETLQGTLNSYIRGFVDAKEDFTQADLDALIADGKIGFEALANLPRSERNTLTNEELGEFSKFYFTAAQELLGKNEAQATAAAAVFNSRVKKIAGAIPALTKIKGDLEKFLELANDEQLSEHNKALTYLFAKIDEYLAEDITADSL